MQPSELPPSLPPPSPQQDTSEPARKTREIFLSLSSLTWRDPFDPNRVEDEIQSILYVTLALFDAVAGMSKEGARTARLVQRKYQHLLYKYLRGRHSDPVVLQQRLGQGMCAVRLAKEAQRIKTEAQAVEQF